MKVSPIILFFFLIATPLFAQISEAESQILRAEITKLVNELRASKNLNPLEPDSILQKAAKNQSIYIAGQKKLTHKQDAPRFATPFKRVKHFKGTSFEIVGENILKSAKIRFPLSKKALLELAKKMFNSWKKSPGHYANLIHVDYEFADLYFHFSKREGVIYATHVFGKKGVKIKGQLSENAFGLKEADDDCSKRFQGFENILANMGNSLMIEGNKVMFYHYSRRYFNKIFNSDDDGLAVDIVERVQFPCDKPNHLDVSPIHDGILLKPVYKQELVKNNTAQSDYRVITEVGTIPDFLRGKDIQLSIVLIQNGEKCRYISPSYAPSKNYRLRPIEPRLYDPPNVELQPEGIVFSQPLIYDFERGKKTPIKYPKIKSLEQKIHSIEIMSYSSIEGNEQSNLQLHNERAKTIKKHILSEVNAKDAKITIETKENWEKMYFQLQCHFAEELIELHKDTLRDFIVSDDDDSLPWDSLLFEQRKSIATINYYSRPIDVSPERTPYINFKTAIYNKDFALANKAMAAMYPQKTYNSIIFEESTFNALKQYPELAQNAAALIAGDVSSYPYKATEFMNSWLNQQDKLSDDAIYNILHLHTRLSRHFISNWDASAKQLSNVIHPDKIKNLMYDEIDSELALNLHMMFLKYFGQINDEYNIDKYFNLVSSYFKQRLVKIEDEIDLVLFFNHWSLYGRTQNYLLKRFYEEKLNEEATFILIQTLNFYSEEGQSIDDYEDIYLKALSLNQERWCQWIRKDFQILRDPKAKEIYCEKCK